MLKIAVYHASRSCDLQERQQTSDFHLREQAPGKWASIAKKNVPEQKKMPNPAASRSAAQEPSPAAATAPTSAPVDASASSPKAAPAAVLPIAAPAEATAAAAAPKEETAEEKIKRLEMQVEALTKQRAMEAAAAAAAAAAAPQKKKGWGPVVTPQVNGALANGLH